jgi:hypothetical protein
MKVVHWFYAEEVNKAAPVFYAVKVDHSSDGTVFLLRREENTNTGNSSE